MADKLVEDLKLALGDGYTILRELTGGGMSRVFVAMEHALGREVVIKVLPPDLAAGVNRDRFRREVQLAARLSHPYIVPLLHAGEHGELLWFTMPYIPGESLRARLQRDGAMPLPEVVRLLHDVVEALAYAHSRGVIHRDIKPGNILSDGKHALVTDFGVAKALNAALPAGGPGHTTSGMAIGTPAYMAPEQLAADPDADHRVDIYAVGLLAYELLSGASPFAAPSPTATMTAQLTRVPPPLHQLRADIPPAFSDLVQHCLAKSPEDRPPDAQAVLTELDRISGALAADAHRSTSGETAMRPHASTVPLVIATFVVLALVAGGFLWSQRGGQHPPARAALAPPLTGDTGQVNTVPTPPLTRQDSLNIAQALRDQLAQIDPNYQKKPVNKAKVPDSVAIDRQIKQTDSLIRERLRELSTQRVTISGGGVTANAPIGAVGAPTAPTPPAVGSRATVSMGTRPTPERLMIYVSPPRGRAADSLLDALQRRAASELARRSQQFGEWQAVTVDTTEHRGPDRQATPDADVLVGMSMQRQRNDSVRLQVTVRNAAAGTNYGYSVVTSDPVYQPTTIQPFLKTIRDASVLLMQLRFLPPGQVWTQDMGRGGRNFGGPNASAIRSFTSIQVDSMRKAFDSLRAFRPRRKDSMP